MSGADVTLVRRPSLGLTLVSAQTTRAFGRHSHDQYGFGVMDSGAHRSRSGRGEVEACAGQIITVNPGEVHDGRPVGDRPRSWRMIYLDPSVVAGLTQNTRDYEFEHPAGDDPQAVRELRHIFEHPEDDALAIESLIVGLLSRLGVRKPGAMRGYPASVHRALTLIDDDSARPLSLEDLAAAAGLGRFQLIRAVRRATGLTPHAYLVQRRVDRARHLILAGVSLAEAAFTAGFADQSHMTRAFVTRHGFTPGRLAAAR